MAISHLRDLTPDPRNARKRTQRSAGMIARSLERFGAARSIVIDEEGQIIAGHGTVEAAAQVGIESVMVVPIDGNTLVAVQRSNLTPEEKVKLAVADNRTSDLSEWDAEILAGLAKDHDLSDWFTMEELVEIMPDPDPGAADPEEDSESREVECPSCGCRFTP